MEPMIFDHRGMILVWFPDGSLVARRPDKGVDGLWKSLLQNRNKLTKAHGQEKAMRLQVWPKME